MQNTCDNGMNNSLYVPFIDQKWFGLSTGCLKNDSIVNVS